MVISLIGFIGGALIAGIVGGVAGGLVAGLGGIAFLVYVVIITIEFVIGVFIGDIIEKVLK